MSPLAHHVLGGVLTWADQLCAVLNPTVNSCKRINTPATLSGATWSPNPVTWAGNNRASQTTLDCRPGPPGEKGARERAPGPIVCRVVPKRRARGSRAKLEKEAVWTGRPAGWR